MMSALGSLRLLATAMLSPVCTVTFGGIGGSSGRWSTAWMSKPLEANWAVVAPRKQPTSTMVLALVLAAIARMRLATSGSVDQIAGRSVGGSAGR